jgi:hypothetical protein
MLRVDGAIRTLNDARSLAGICPTCPVRDRGTSCSTTPCIGKAEDARPISPAAFASGCVVPLMRTTAVPAGLMMRSLYLGIRRGRGGKEKNTWIFKWRPPAARWHHRDKCGLSTVSASAKSSR